MRPFVTVLSSMFLTAACVVAVLLLPAGVAAAPGDLGECTSPLNISDSPGYSSADPFLLADPSGVVHLFYAERVLGAPNAIPNIADTLMYAVWDGQSWSEPVDIFISPPQYPNRRIQAPMAVLDDQGTIHLIWIGPDNRFYYSSAYASEAGTARSWQRPVTMANDQSMTVFSIGIAYEAPDTLHVIYASGTGGAASDDFRTNRAVSYVGSEDLGRTWSDPADIFTFSDPGRGASSTQLIVDPPGRLYAAWTEWDFTGNGQAVYFSRSLDSGKTWQEPVVLDERDPNDYERDWANLAVLDKNQLVALWEGGYRAYPQTQYSSDGGATWSEPNDTFYWLIADNGFAQFVRDSADSLHVFLIRRIREGHSSKCNLFPGCSEEGSSIWHSVWEGGTNWREPNPTVWLNEIGGNYLTVAITGGNQIIMAWFGSGLQEIFTSVCSIRGASAVEPIRRTLPTSTATPAAVPTDIPTATPTAETVAPSALGFSTTQPLAKQRSNPGSLMMLALIPPLLTAAMIVVMRRNR